MEILDKIFNNVNLSQSYIFLCDNVEIIDEISLEFAYKIVGSRTNVIGDSIVFFKNYNKSITINDVRLIKSEIMKKPIYCENKVVIISNSDKMTIESQNAILKTLEDYNKNIFIVLIVTDMKKILNTIISRCVVVNFNSILKHDYHNISITYNNKDSEKIYELIINTLINFNMYKFSDFNENIINLATYKDKADIIIDMLYMFIRDLFIYINTKNGDMISNAKFLLYIVELDKFLKNFNIEEAIYNLEKFKNRVKLNINFELSFRVFIFGIGGNI